MVKAYGTLQRIGTIRHIGQLKRRMYNANNERMYHADSASHSAHPADGNVLGRTGAMTGKSQIEVRYCEKSNTQSHYLTCITRFTDWYDFADWLKQATLQGPVLITSWNYVK